MQALRPYAVLLLFLFAGCAKAYLHEAANRGDAAGARKLLDQGADVNAPLTPENQTRALCYAANAEVAKVLLDRGARASYAELYCAAISGRADVVKVLLDRGVPVNGPAHVDSLLHAATKTCPYLNPHMVRMLLDQGADPQSRDSNGRTPLEAARGLSIERWCGPGAGERLAAIVRMLDDATAPGAARPVTAGQIGKQLAAMEAEGLAADAARKAGNNSEALEHFTLALKAVPEQGERDPRVTVLRRKAVGFAAGLFPTPAVPQEAQDHALLGQAYIKKAMARKDLLAAEKELRSATNLAFWWADAYYNLAVVQEKVTDFQGAIDSLELYLLASPEAQDAGKVRGRIAELKVSREQAGRSNDAAGADHQGTGLSGLITP